MQLKIVIGLPVIVRKRISAQDTDGNQAAAIVKTGPCPTNLTYIYLTNEEDNRRWVVSLKSMGLEANHGTHNHHMPGPMPGKSKVYSKVKEDMEMTMENIQILSQKISKRGKEWIIVPLMCALQQPMSKGCS